MKKVFGLLYTALLLAPVLPAQTSRPEQPASGTLPPPARLIEQLPSLPKRYPPELAPSSRTAGPLEVKLTHTYCVQPGAGGKSLSVKRCESVPPGIRLIAPFKSTVPGASPRK